MSHTFQPSRLTSIFIVVLWGGCQFIGGLDDLRLAPGSGGTGGDSGGAGGASSSISTGTNGVGGADGGPPITTLWSKRFGDAAAQYVTDLAVDDSQNIFLAGAFRGTIDFGQGMTLVSNADDVDAFLVKLDPNGDPIWVKKFGAAGPDRIESLSLTKDGDPIVGGSYSNAITIDATDFTHKGGLDGFVMRFASATGMLTWGHGFGDAQNQRCASVAVALTADNIVCLGDFSGVVTFGSTNLTSMGLDDLFLVRYASDGTFTSAVRAGDSAQQSARSLAVNASGFAYAAAQFEGTINWGPQTSAGQGDVFLGGIPASGTASWTLRFGDSNTQQPNGMSLVPNAASAVLVGNFEGSADFGGKAVSSLGGFDAFVTRVDSMGVVSWIRTIGDADPKSGIDDQYATDVAAMNDGSLFVTGYVAGTVNFGSEQISGPGDNDFFVMRLDPTGQTVWSFRSGSGNSQYGRAIALSGADEIVVAGDFRETLNFGNDPLTSAGSNDIFIAKLQR